MAGHHSDPAQTPGPVLPAGNLPRSHGRLTTALAVLALATAGYALWRVDATRDRLDQVNDIALKFDAERQALRAELKSLASRERQARRDLDRRLDLLDAVPRQMRELGASLEEMRGRTEGPERAWSKSEALFLMEIAQRSLALDRDVETAVVALESADARLATLRDPAVVTVRQQIAREVQSLRSIDQPDTTGILARLASAEQRALNAPVKGIVVIERTPSDVRPLPQGWFDRAVAVMRNAIVGLVSIRKVDERAGSITTLEEQVVRRQHLQLQLFAARNALVRHDAAAYRSALASAREWLGEFFELSDPAAAALLNEVQTLEPINIAPALPDISASARTLQRLMPIRSAASPPPA